MHSGLLLGLLLACQGPKSTSQPTEEEPVRAIDQASAEMRGIWITRFSWEGEAELRGMIDHASAVGFNAVFFQVRGSFDALYASSLEPWAASLSGELGKDPGWDPLAVVVEHAHFLGMEVHAYLNTYPLWKGIEPPVSAGIPHALQLHPNWVIRDEAGQAKELNEHYIFASPGHPEVSEHVYRVATDVAERYEIDGLHMDYVRYPDAAGSFDAASQHALQSQGLDRLSWQREQPGRLLGRISEAIDIPLSAAVWGVYEDRFGWGRVSEGLHDYHQDSHGWLSQGQVDAIAPMIYWGLTEIPGERLDFSTLLEDHMVHSSGRHIYAGVGGEKIGMDQVIACIGESRRQGAAGVVLFDYSLFEDELYRLGTGLFSSPAVPPVMPWRELPGVGYPR